MSGHRLAVSAPGADAAEITQLARIAESQNLDAVVVGAIRNGVPNSDDTYVAAAAGAAAMCTRHLRIGVALDLRGSASPLRVAEDIGVLDVMSAGRLELLLRPGPDQHWSQDLAAVFGAWSGWRLDDGRVMPVTPTPVQPNIPTWMVEHSSDPRVAHPLAQGDSVLFVEWPETAFVPDAAALHKMRRTRDAAGAATVVIDLGATPAPRRAEIMTVLGSLVGPCLRCAADEVDILAIDTTEWLLRRTELHRPPLTE